MLFITSTGLASCSTNGARLGDGIWSLYGKGTPYEGLHGSSYKSVLVTSTDGLSSSVCTGKGLSLPFLSYPEGTIPGISPPESRLGVDIVTLLYVAGCF